MSSENTPAIAPDVMARMTYQELEKARDEASIVCRRTSDWLAGEARLFIVKRFTELDAEVQKRRAAAGVRNGPYHSACGKNHPLHEQCWGADEMRAATEPV